MLSRKIAIACLLPLAVMLASATGCQTDITGDDQYYACAPASAGDADERCRDGYTCRSVDGNPGCVPEDEAGDFPEVDDNEGDAGMSDAEDGGEDDAADGVAPSDADDSEEPDDTGPEDTEAPDTTDPACEDAMVQIEAVDSGKTKEVALTESLEDTLPLELESPQEVRFKPGGELPDEATLDLFVVTEPYDLGLYNVTNNLTSEVTFEPLALASYELMVSYPGGQSPCDIGIEVEVMQPRDALYVELIWGLDETSSDTSLSLYFKPESPEWTAEHEVESWLPVPDGWQVAQWGPAPEKWNSEPPPGPISFVVAQDDNAADQSFDIGIDFGDAQPGAVLAQVLITSPTQNLARLNVGSEQPGPEAPFLRLGTVHREQGMFVFTENLDWIETPGQL